MEAEQTVPSGGCCSLPFTPQADRKGRPGPFSLKAPCCPGFVLARFARLSGAA